MPRSAGIAISMLMTRAVEDGTGASLAGVEPHVSR